MTQGAPERSTRSRENTRLRLLEAAAEVFAEVGVDAASVEAITERAGFTRGAFYSNFESKEELVFALVSWASDREMTAVGERVQAMDESQLRSMSIEQIVTRILDVVVDSPSGVRLMNEFRTRAMRDERTAQAYLDWQRGLQQRVAAIIDELARGTGMRLRIGSSDLAQLILFIWEGTSVHAVIEGDGDDSVTDQVCRPTVALLTALVSDDTRR